MGHLITLKQGCVRGPLLPTCPIGETEAKVGRKGWCWHRAGWHGWTALITGRGDVCKALAPVLATAHTKHFTTHAGLSHVCIMHIVWRLHAVKTPGTDCVSHQSHTLEGGRGLRKAVGPEFSQGTRSSTAPFMLTQDGCSAGLGILPHSPGGCSLASPPL